MKYDVDERPHGLVISQRDQNRYIAKREKGAIRPQPARVITAYVIID